MTTLQEAASLSSHERGLVVVSTLRANGTIQSSLVNAGVLAHPVTGVRPSWPWSRLGPVKLANLRARPQVTATFRNGWPWAAVEGRAELTGPDDPPTLAGRRRAAAFAPRDFHRSRRRTRRLGRVRPGDAEQRRAAVLIRPDRVYSN